MVHTKGFNTIKYNNSQRTDNLCSFTMGQDFQCSSPTSDSSFICQQLHVCTPIKMACYVNQQDSKY